MEGIVEVPQLRFLTWNSAISETERIQLPFMQDRTLLASKSIPNHTMTTFQDLASSSGEKVQVSAPKTRTEALKPGKLSESTVSSISGFSFSQLFPLLLHTTSSSGAWTLSLITQMVGSKLVTLLDLTMLWAVSIGTGTTITRWVLWPYSGCPNGSYTNSTFSDERLLWCGSYTSHCYLLTWLPYCWSTPRLTLKLVKVGKISERGNGLAWE